jgi:hypothetical protein
MYQFPDSKEMMEPKEPEPLKKGTSYRIIIIANLLLSLLVVAVVWFVFFFKPDSTNTPEVDLSLTTKPIGDFTPIIINNESSDSPTLLEVNNTISSITETTTRPISNGEVIDLQLENAKVFDEKNNTHKTQKETIAKEQQQTTTLSAIDLITNELMKNKSIQASKKQESNTPPAVLPSQPIPPAETNNSEITVQKEKQQPLKENQINLKQTTALPLGQLLQKTQQTLSHSDKKLIAEINAVDSSSNKKDKPTNTDTYNSIPLNTGSDIDKIMAAMGNTKKPADIATIEKIDKVVKKLLKSEESNSIKTTQYIKKLQPETEENRKATRSITVREGEKLWDIAVRAYGDGNKYKKILQANPLLKTNPKLLKAGVTLRAPL